MIPEFILYVLMELMIMISGGVYLVCFNGISHFKKDFLQFFNGINDI